MNPPSSNPPSTGTTVTSGTETGASYGIVERRTAETDLDRAAEEIGCLGYSVVDSGYSAGEIDDMARIFDAVHEKYVRTYGEKFLREIDEYNGIRLPLLLDEQFMELATNRRILDLAGKLIRNKFILNQQNGIINPSGETYNQAAWHRDLPYQHFVSSRPLAVNALYCVDDFTADNGATFVLPGSHAQEEYPSDFFVEKNARQITAPAGSFIVLHCMLFHRGASNRTAKRRRAVNHLYSAPFIKQQIDISSALSGLPARSQAVAELLGFRYAPSRSVGDYLASRRR